MEKIVSIDHLLSGNGERKDRAKYILDNDYDPYNFYVDEVKVTVRFNGDKNLNDLIVCLYEIKP